jgi:radial spoke head protein 4A
MANSPDALGNSIYDQLSAVLLHILKTKPENPIPEFESLVSAVKDRELDPAFTKKKPLTFRDVSDTNVAAEGCALYQEVELPVNANGQQTSVVDPIDCYIPDLVAEATMLEWAGVALRQEEQFRLQLAMRRLAYHDRSLKAMRFWGKIFCTKGQYYVVEATMKDIAASLPELPEGKLRDPARRNIEKAKRFNEMKYFVCGFPGAPWIPLPHVTYEQLKAQPNVNKLFSGNLEAAVESFPQFPGNEAAYLRATIAVISSKTVISPNGYFSIDEGGEQEDGSIKYGPTVVKAEEFEAPEMEALSSIAGWTNHYPKIPEADPLPEPVPEEEEEPEEPEEPPEEEPFEEEPVALEPMAEPEEGKDADFILRKCSTLSDFAPISVLPVQLPGATTVAMGKAFVNIYMGWGLPLTTTAFAPPVPPPVCVEAPELHEQEELNEKVDFPPDADGKGDADENAEEEEG